MYNLVTEEFTAYNGKKLTFTYREDTNDRNVILSITRDDEYLTSKMTYQPGDTFVDVGAHIGAWSALMEKLVPEAKIIAVEPLPENIDLIVENTHAKRMQYAVANRNNMKIKIYYGDNSESGLHHRFNGNTQIRGDQYYLASTINLQTLLRDLPHVRVLKIDCEGGEHSFFRFADKKTLAKIDYIIGEYHNVPVQTKNKTRAALLKSMKGLFEDISENKEENFLGGFWFRRKEINVET